jgi:hypothetical protein
MDMNIMIGLASMAGCIGMFLVCAMQVWEIVEEARKMIWSSQAEAAPWATASVRFAHERRYTSASGAIFVPSGF